MRHLTVEDCRVMQMLRGGVRRGRPTAGGRVVVDGDGSFVVVDEDGGWGLLTCCCSGMLVGDLPWALQLVVVN